VNTLDVEVGLQADLRRDRDRLPTASSATISRPNIVCGTISGTVRERKHMTLVRKRQLRFKTARFGRSIRVAAVMVAPRCSGTRAHDEVAWHATVMKLQLRLALERVTILQIRWQLMVVRVMASEWRALQRNPTRLPGRRGRRAGRIDVEAGGRSAGPVSTPPPN